MELPDGSRQGFAKVTRLKVPKGSTVHLHTGGGGGYGDPAGRDPEDVRRDLRDGYISEEHARDALPAGLRRGRSVSAGRRLIEVEHLAPMALGCSVLGAGGGGDTYTSLLASRYAIERFGPVELVDLDELPDDGSGHALRRHRRADRRRSRSWARARRAAGCATSLERVRGGRWSALMAAEIGGANGIAARSTGRPRSGCRWSTPTAWAAPSRRCRR